MSEEQMKKCPRGQRRDPKLCVEKKQTKKNKPVSETGTEEKAEVQEKTHEAELAPKDKTKKCPHGQRRDPKTKLCVEKKQTKKNKPVSEGKKMEEPEDKSKKCPRGQKRDPKTKLCVEKNQTKKNKIVTPQSTNLMNILPSSLTGKKRESESVQREGEDLSHEMFNEISMEKDEEKDEENQEKDEENDEEKDGEEIEEIVKDETDFRRELDEHISFKKETNRNESLYPDINDPDFNKQIAKKQIFQDTKYDGKIFPDIEQQAKEECEMDFEIMPHQQFVRNFMSLDTPYNSLFLFHELGTGKTCSAIGITEEMRHFTKQTDPEHPKKIFIVASPNVQENFRSQLFDSSKLVEIGRNTGVWNMNTCVGNSLIREVTAYQSQPLTKEQISRRIESTIRNHYSFIGYDRFAIIMEDIGEVEKITDSDSLEVKANKQLKIDMIRREFDHSLMVIDEVHNIIGENKKTKKTSNMLIRLVTLCDNIRFLFLSATPMYNSYREIVWLTNLMNLNDRRPIIATSDVFQEDGEFVDEKKDEKGLVLKESGEDLLKRKLIGYVSYVRGENPYAFPFRIYPSEFAEKEHQLSQKTYPTKQMNKKTITSSISFLDIYVTKMESYQLIAYQLLINESYKDKNKKFSELHSFGYAWLQSPLSMLNIVYPTEELDAYIENQTPIDHNTLLECHGILGLNTIMDYKEQEVPPALFDFEYKPNIEKKHGRIFAKENIGKYSAKIGEICKCIEQSSGIVLVYSKYIQGGLIPVALALEEMGFYRHGNNKSLLKEKKTALDYLTMRPMNEETKFTASYVMITGQKNLSSNNKVDVKAVVQSSNFDGKMVKVVLISEAGSEGLDFKNIRQVHILDPWYNMNRIEQIIGRAVRNRSHCQLPFEQRNVEIYMHATYIDENEESADMYMYRLAEQKAKSIGKITRILKETAVDCLLNIEQQNYSQSNMNTTLDIVLSSNQKKLKYVVGDKPYSKNCDFMETCEYSCKPSMELPKPNTNDYTESYLKNNYDRLSKRIRQLYRSSIYYSLEDLLREIQIGKPFPIEQIYYTLSLFVDNKNEWLVDKNERKGYLTVKNDIYVFQPLQISDLEASIYERSVPVDIKPREIHIRLPEQNQVPVVADKKLLTTSKVNIILEEMNEKMTLILNKKYNKTTNKEWYLNARLAFDVLTEQHKIQEKQCIVYFLSHILDTMLFADRFVLLQHFFTSKEDFVANLDISQDISLKSNKINKEKIIRNYFLQKMNFQFFQDTDTCFILLCHNNENELYTWQKTWKPSTVSEKEKKEIISWKQHTFDKKEQILERVNEEHTIIKEDLDSDIGFIGILKTNETDGYGFKTKNVLQKRNNFGARCNETDKQKLIVKLNLFLEAIEIKEIYSKDPVLKSNSESIERIHLCIIYELLMRHYTILFQRIFFLSPEEANESNISGMSITTKKVNNKESFIYKKK